MQSAKELPSGKASPPINGLIFFVTTNLEHRYENLFRKHEHAELVRACLFDFCDEMKYSVYAWVIMPDHLHAVIRLRGDKTLSQVMNRVKGVASRKINLLRGHGGNLWQESFHDEAIRNERQMNATIDYIHYNPIRPGLVENPEDYEFSSYRAFLEGKIDFS